MSATMVLAKLKHQLEEKVSAFRGIAGVSLLDVATGERVQINGDEQFPTASTIKIHLLAALEQLHFERKLDLDERVVITPDLIVPGSGVLTYLDDEVELSWRDVANLMIIVSDNTATNMVIDLLGYDRMAEFMNKWGLERTVLRRKMQEHDAVARNEENLSTPNEEARIMELLLDGSRFGQGVAEETLRILKKPKRGFIRPGLPVELEIANKPGAMDYVRCDVAIVYQRRRPFILSVMTKYGRYEPAEQEAWIADVTRDVYEVIALFDVTNDWGQGILPAYR